MIPRILPTLYLLGIQHRHFQLGIDLPSASFCCTITCTGSLLCAQQNIKNNDPSKTPERLLFLKSPLPIEELRGFILWIVCATLSSAPPVKRLLKLATFWSHSADPHSDLHSFRNHVTGAFVAPCHFTGMQDRIKLRSNIHQRM